MAKTGPPSVDAGPIDVFVVASVRLYEELLAEALAADPRFRVVGGAASSAEALGALRPAVAQAEVIIIDVGPPAGFDQARMLNVAEPGPRLVALGVNDPYPADHTGGKARDEILRWAEAGVSGFITREARIPEVLQAVELVARNGSMCSPSVARALLNRVAEVGVSIERPAMGVKLSEREHEIFVRIERGMRNKQIADELHVSVATVKNHVHSILEKLDAKSRGEAVAIMRDTVGDAVGR